MQPRSTSVAGFVIDLCIGRATVRNNSEKQDRTPGRGPIIAARVCGGLKF